MDGTFYVEADAPDPRACTADSECLGDTVTDPGGCCVISPDPIAQTWAYHTWLSTHRMSAACTSAHCEQLNPSRPRDCAFAVRCAEGRCVNSCP